MVEQTERSLFLETTIHILRRTGSNDRKTRIARNIRGRHVITSTYVQSEYVNTFLRAAVDMYNLVQDAEDVLDACGRWDQERGGHYKMGMGALMIAIVESSLDKDEVLTRLRGLIEKDIPAWFAQDVEEITDATQCEAANY
jgi:hypothetical protein